MPAPGPGSRGRKPLAGGGEPHDIVKSVLRLLQKSRRRIAGVACRSSADAVEVALVDVEAARTATGAGLAWELLASVAVPHPDAVRAEIVDVLKGAEREAERLTRLHFLLAHLAADAVEAAAHEAGVALPSVDAVAVSGQVVRRFPSFPHTILHRDGPGADSWGREDPAREEWVSASVLEIGEPAVIAERVGTPVLSGFRARDVAAGGDGGRLFVPVDRILFSHPARARLVVHLDGVTRFTALPATGTPAAAVAADRGPGVILLDALLERMSDGARHHDEGGALARKGKADPALVEEFLEAGKSTTAGSPGSPAPSSAAFPGSLAAPFPPGLARDPGAFAGAFLERGRRKKLSDASILASAVQLVASALYEAYRRSVEPSFPVDEVIVTGRGAHNVFLLESLSRGFPEAQVVPSDYYGLDVDATEALSLALLAHLSLGSGPGDPNDASAGPVVTGSITPAEKESG